MTCMHVCVYAYALNQYYIALNISCIYNIIVHMPEYMSEVKWRIHKYSSMVHIQCM